MHRNVYKRSRLCELDFPYDPLTLEFYEFQKICFGDVTYTKTFLWDTHNFHRICGGKKFLDITKDDVIKYKNFLESSNPNGRVSNRLRNYYKVRAFFIWLRNEKQYPISDEVVDEFVKREEYTRPPTNKYYKDIRRQKKIVDLGQVNEKASALWYLIFSTGLHFKEIVQIKREHLQLEHCRILTFSSKGEKKLRFILPECRDAIRLYLLKETVNSEYLFHDANGNKSPYHILKDAFDTVVRKSDSKFCITSQKFREIVTVLFLKSGMDLMWAKYLLGVSLKKILQLRNASDFKISPSREYTKYIGMLYQTQLYKKVKHDRPETKNI